MIYSDITTMFTSILNRTDLTPTLTDTFTTVALLRAQRELRVPATEILLSGVLAGGYIGIAVPTGFNHLIQYMWNGVPLDYVTPAVFLALQQDGAIAPPTCFTRVNGYFQVYPAPSIGDIYGLYYYGNFTAFSGASSSTPLSIDYPDLLIYGALSYAADYYLDERGPTFEQRYQGIRQTIQDNASTIDGSARIMPTVTFGDPLNE